MKDSPANHLGLYRLSSRRVWSPEVSRAIAAASIIIITADEGCFARPSLSRSETHTHTTNTRAGVMMLTLLTRGVFRQGNVVGSGKLSFFI